MNVKAIEKELMNELEKDILFNRNVLKNKTNELQESSYRRGYENALRRALNKISEEVQS